MKQLGQLGEAVEEESVKTDVRRTQLGEDAALGAAQVGVYLWDGAEWAGIIEEGEGGSCMSSKQHKVVVRGSEVGQVTTFLEPPSSYAQLNFIQGADVTKILERFADEYLTRGSEKCGHPRHQRYSTWPQGISKRHKYKVLMPIMLASPGFSLRHERQKEQQRQDVEAFEPTFARPICVPVADPQPGFMLASHLVRSFEKTRTR
ncbi:hypothetical protein DFH06DRAFT_334251 [Mycena polygramma]|nr:hypothetical protein DFH06DRAFT_334251 [Mycena polygramma]